MRRAIVFLSLGLSVFCSSSFAFLLTCKQVGKHASGFFLVDDHGMVKASAIFHRGEKIESCFIDNQNYNIEVGLGVMGHIKCAEPQKSGAFSVSFHPTIKKYSGSIQFDHHPADHVQIACDGG